MTPKAKKKRAADLMYYRELKEAGGDLSQGVPPSKAKKVIRKQSKKGGAPREKEVVGPSVTFNDLNTFFQQHMATFKAMMHESVQGLRQEFLSGSSAHGPNVVGAGVTASVESPRGVSPMPNLGSPELPLTVEDQGLGPVSLDVLAQGPLTIPGLEPDSLAPASQPKSTELPVLPGDARESRDRGSVVEPVQSTGLRPLDAFGPLAPSGLSSGVSLEINPFGGIDPERASEEDSMDVDESEELEGSFKFSSALREVRQRIAVALPQAAVPAKPQDPTEFRLPGEAFAPRQPTQTRLRVLPSLVRDVVDPLLLGNRSRFDLPDLVRRYQMGDDELFSVPQVDECVYTSVALGGASAPSLSTPVARQGRHVPPFPSAGPTLKAAYRCFEEQYRNATQQVRVVVHGAYLSSLQRAALETEKDSGDSSPHAVLLSQLTEVQSHLARDSLRSAASQMMCAVMGMRKLWLSTSRYSIATQNSLLALPFRMGSTLFPGAQQVVREAADAVASFKDSKALLEQPRPSRSRAPGPGLSSTSVGPTPAPAQWLQPLGRGKRKTRRSKGKGKGAGGAQQPFRGRGRSAQASL